jgi:hypothetical protein
VAGVVRVTLTEKPEDGSTHRPTRTLPQRIGISRGAVARIWRDRELQPWKVNTFKISTDPQFEEKLIDVLGLYFNSPAKAVAFCFDEKTRIQALDRTQPSLPMVRGRAGTISHDNPLNGVTDLFAALNVATGEVLTQCRKRHTSATKTHDPSTARQGRRHHRQSPARTAPVCHKSNQNHSSSKLVREHMRRVQQSCLEQ